MTQKTDPIIEAINSLEIDTFTEAIISLLEGAEHISKISGKKRNKRVLIRWSNRGVAGVKLPTIRIGGELYTSQEKLNWFLNASREAKRQKQSTATKEGIAKAQNELEKKAQELGV